MWFSKQMNKWGLNSDQWFMAHEEVAKIKYIPSFEKRQRKAKLILVSAMNPTPSGEGKTTTVIGLTDALNILGLNAIATLRQPSVGPVFGKKGGATGGGAASVVPHDRIDLGLSGDFYAVENANNMLAALIDNHMYFKQSPELKEILWRRCLDMNDRALRSVKTPFGIRDFTITAASELMAILSLSRSFKELKEKIGNCVIAVDESGKLIQAKDLNFQKAPAVLLRDAFYPNLVKTLEGSPVIMHAGPFANIAQGTSSIVSTELALELGDYVVTEAGFGAELGAEKFFNIKCRLSQFEVACTVLVATTQAIQMHGLENVLIHVENLRKFGPDVVVCLNRFPNDLDQDLLNIIDQLKTHSITCQIGNGFAQGGEGMMELAQSVVETATSKEIKYTYDLSDSIEGKVHKIATSLYRASGVEWTAPALEKRELYKDYAHLPICMAKSPLSLTDDPKTKFVKDGHIIHIRDLKLQAGAGFITALTGEVHLLPGLPKSPRAFDVDLSDSGEIIWN